ncbi:SHOCT domain-containing protein [Leifsonia sp. YIM 134122]|uniref:SHOCT domain-containing protein n=1 Tax=Leifsonia stereocauli TaxID=3134136 RepID=A0ABU9W6A6_9MICO
MFSDFWGFVWVFFWAFAYIAYLFVLIYILADIFRDKSLNGGLKALWIIAMVFLPFLTAVVYLIARGTGMNERAAASANTEILSEDRSSIQAQSYADPQAEIAKAAALRDQGVITPGEFDAIKAKAEGKKF